MRPLGLHEKGSFCGVGGKSVNVLKRGKQSQKYILLSRHIDAKRREVFGIDTERHENIPDFSNKKNWEGRYKVNQMPKNR